MPELIPVDHDPFAAGDNPPGGRLVPVEHDPFKAEPGLAARARDAIGSAGDFAVNLVTGNDRREFNYPEAAAVLPLEKQKAARFFMSLGRDDIRKLDLLRTYTGQDYEADLDKFGNVYITTPEGKSAYLNRPGLSRQDMTDLATSMKFEVPMSLAGGKAGDVLLKGVGRILGLGAGAGVGSILQDVAATTAGSRRGVDLPAAALTGALGAGGEVVTGLAGKLLTRFFSNGALFDATKRAPTDAGKAALKNIGIDPDAITPDFYAQWEELTRKAVAPDQAARTAAAETLPERVPLSKGQITRDFDQLSFEEDARKGVMGPGARENMDTLRKAQDEAVGKNVTAIQDQMSGGQRSVSVPGEGAAAAQEELIKRKAELKARVDAKYQTVRDKGDAYLPGEQASILADRMQVGTSIDLADAPAVDAIVKRIRGMNENVEGVQATWPVLVRTLERQRGSLSELTRSAQPIERKAAVEALREFDGHMDQMVTDSLIRGDSSVIEALTEARSLRKELGKTFERKNIVGLLTKIGDDGLPTVDPTDAVNVIFGAGQLGAKRGTIAEVRRLEKTLGSDSPQWNAIREEAFLRMMRTTRDIDPFALDIGFDKAMRNNPELVKTLLGDQFNSVRQLRDVISQIKYAPSGTVNYSNTLNKLAQFLNRNSGMMGNWVGAAMNKVIAPIANSARGMEVSAATGGGRGFLPARGTIVPPYVGGSAAASLESQLDTRVSPDDGAK